MKFIYRVYSICIALPIFVVVTIVVAVLVSIFSILGDSKYVGYYAPKLWSRITCALFLIRIETTGREYLDKKSSYVFLANHQGYFDIFLVYGYLGHNFKWMMKEYLRKIPFVGYACDKSGHIYVGNSLASIQKAVKLAQKTLRGGMSMVIFPEGTRTYDGKMSSFKKGAFTLANEIGLPIVPITINGSFDTFSRTAKFVTCHKISMVIHKPIEVAERKGKPTKVIMDEVFNIINGDIEEKYRV